MYKQLNNRENNKRIVRARPRETSLKKIDFNELSEAFNKDRSEKRLVQVCTECGRASCWHGDFLCNESKSAGIELKTAKELDKNNLENKDHYSLEMIKRVFGEIYPFGFKDQL